MNAKAQPGRDTQWFSAIGKYESRFPVKFSEFPRGLVSVVMVRHAATPQNRDEVVVGQIDPSLDELGIAQATRLADSIQNLPINRIFSSNLLRSRQTAEIIGSQVGIPVEADIRLTEIDYGTLDGRSKQSVEYKRAVIERLQDKYHYRSQGGESLADVECRSREFLECVLQRLSNPVVLIVTHLGVIRTFAKIFCDLPTDTAAYLEAEHLSISVVDISRRSSVWGGSLLR